MSPERRCGTCRWWCDRGSEVDPSEHDEDCKRHAPILATIWVRLPGEQTAHYPMPMWPHTYPDDFCGEWAARKEDIAPLSSLVAGAEWTSIEEARDA